MYKITLLCLLFLSLNAKNFTTMFDKHSLIIPKGSIYLQTHYLQVNDTIDVLNIKEKELGSLKRFGAIGDMQGYEFAVTIGLTDNISFYTNYQKSIIDFNSFDLVNKQINLFTRFKIFKNLTLDLGIITNKANPYSITDNLALDTLIKKFKPNSNAYIKDGDIIFDDITIGLYDKDGWKIYPRVDFKELESKSYYIKILTSKSFFSNHLIDFYIGLKKTDIKTTIDFYPKDDLVLKNIEIPKLNRSEKDVSFGITYSYKYKKYALEVNYEYHQLFRDEGLDYIDYNHIVNTEISREITDNLLIYIGGKIMTQQFNTDIPYIYNRYTQTQFDKKYGYAKIGFIYKFDSSF